ncbi:sensor histidine kinase [Tessaracoccus caeni]|uniref:sensor histidine kinase n=1 Tax=Tessaracoccus caeni TaxID=3031239 RepID=UPI0023DBB66F|nr:histidine kinase [Tessaracoccus caeni]MDF1488214.1 histidine kinase [Tessaracoccus caeni]
MSSTDLGVRRSEGYLYGSLHQGYPILPSVVLLSLFERDVPWSWLVGWALLILAAGWAALTVLHSRLRDLGLLPPSRWDRLFRSSRHRLFLGAWVVLSLAATGVAGLFAPEDPVLLAISNALLGGMLALPALLLRVRGTESFPASTPRLGMAITAAIGLALFAVWAIPTSDSSVINTRISISFLSGFFAAFLVGFGSMFINVIATTRALERARTDEARLAVAEERVRFSRDLHDVFGRTLSAVALKSELAAAQAERGRPEAAATMREVQAIATDALTEVREVVRGYREADLASEVAGTKALLEAVGIAVTTLHEGTALLPAPVARAFAWTVREAATNVLRHADATVARIVVTSEEGLARLEISNDRPHPSAEHSGSGLAGLAERLAEVGGTLSWEHDADSFRLTATVDAIALANLRQLLRKETA